LGLCLPHCRQIICTKSSVPFSHQSSVPHELCKPPRESVAVPTSTVRKPHSGHTGARISLTAEDYYHQYGRGTPQGCYLAIPRPAYLGVACCGFPESFSLVLHCSLPLALTDSHPPSISTPQTGFTDSVERLNPVLVASDLAVWRRHGFRLVPRLDELAGME
jgi:hypothetical protein